MKQKIFRLTVLFIACLQPAFGAWLYFVSTKNPEVARIFYSSSKIFQFSMPFILWYWTRAWFTKPSKEVVISSLRIFWESLASGLIFFSAIQAMYFFIFKDSALINESRAGLAEKLQMFHVNSKLSFCVLALGISIFHSLMEESYWRWFVHRLCFLDFSRYLSRVISCLSFTAHHVFVLYAYIGNSKNLIYVPIFSLFVFFAGWIWVYQYERHQKLWGVWLSHSLADFGLMVIGYQIIFL